MLHLWCSVTWLWVWCGCMGRMTFLDCHVVCCDGYIRIQRYFRRAQKYVPPVQRFDTAPFLLLDITIVWDSGSLRVDRLVQERKNEQWIYCKLDQSRDLRRGPWLRLIVTIWVQYYQIWNLRFFHLDKSEPCSVQNGKWPKTVSVAHRLYEQPNWTICDSKFEESFKRKTFKTPNVKNFDTYFLKSHRQFFVLKRPSNRLRKNL